MPPKRDIQGDQERPPTRMELRHLRKMIRQNRAMIVQLLALVGTMATALTFLIYKMMAILQEMFTSGFKH